jgi:hypothetical protein
MANILSNENSHTKKSALCALGKEITLMLFDFCKTILFFLVVLGWGSLWVLQKFLQYINISYTNSHIQGSSSAFH